MQEAIKNRELSLKLGVDTLLERCRYEIANRVNNGYLNAMVHLDGDLPTITVDKVIAKLESLGYKAEQKTSHGEHDSSVYLNIKWCA